MKHVNSEEGLLQAVAARSPPDCWQEIQSSQEVSGSWKDLPRSF